MPADEVLGDPARLAAVAAVLQVAKASQGALDRLAELAAIVMDAPIAIVNLIDTQQHLVGQFGLGEPLVTSRQASIDTGYCPSTFFAGRPLHIEDAAEDPAFADHPARWELGFAAYAGCPLRDADGQLIGTLCVVDTRPRRWRRVDRQALEALATSVVNELALHQDIDRRGRLLDAFAAAPAAIAVTRGPRHLVEYCNPAYSALFGTVPAEMPAREAVPALPAEFFSLMDQVLAGGEVYRTSEAPLTMIWPGEQSPRERFFDFSYSAIGRGADDEVDHRGLLVVAVEVTEQVQTRIELERHARRQELLARASAALNRSLDPTAELQALARVVVPELADLSTVHLLAHPTAPGADPALPVITDRVAVAGAPGVVLPPKLTGLRWDGNNDPITAAIRRGDLVRQPFATGEPPSWSQTTGSVPTFRGGLRNLMVAPVIVDGLIVAVVSFAMQEDRPLWSDDDLHALRQIARYAGIALEHGMSYQATRESAMVLQRSLLTEPPSVSGLRICARYRPAGRDEVGGDWYDAFQRGPDQLALVIGDVVGHDITAAAAMGQLSAILRGLALDRSDGPAAILDRLGAINTQLGITPFATLLFATLTRVDDRWTMCWASAGHPPPLLLTSCGVQLTERVRGTALVATKTPPRDEAQISVAAGSTLLFYTDGLIEWRGQDLTDNLNAFVARAAASEHNAIEPLCDDLIADAPTDDDIAMLAVHVGDG
ncbi:MAG TPA: SpoIIE family protein phosphatase [Pseudonocardiaceae bacterium]|nr:SpoIIE family protein phosphatase [Pseudonocardiaceae bacterium]